MHNYVPHLEKLLKDQIRIEDIKIWFERLFKRIPELKIYFQNNDIQPIVDYFNKLYESTDLIALFASIAVGFGLDNVMAQIDYLPADFIADYPFFENTVLEITNNIKRIDYSTIEKEGINLWIEHRDKDIPNSFIPNHCNIYLEDEGGPMYANCNVYYGVSREEFEKIMEKEVEGYVRG